MGEPGPVEPGRAAEIARVSDRVAALERAGLTPRYVGEQVPYTGTLPATGGEVEVLPGFLLCNGGDVLAVKWPELAAAIGTLYGTPAAGLVRLPSRTADAGMSGYLIYAGRRASTGQESGGAGGTTANFSPTSTSEDGYVASEYISATWHPATANAAYTTASQMLVEAIADGAGNKYFSQALFRFNTATLPDSAVVISAKLRIWITAQVAAETRNLVAEWYDHGGLITTADYTATPTSNAHAGTNVGTIAEDSVLELFLTNVTNVSLTGTCGLRLWIDGAAPAIGQETGVGIADSSYASGIDPTLAVTYTT